MPPHGYMYACIHRRTDNTIVKCLQHHLLDGWRQKNDVKHRIAFKTTEQTKQTNTCLMALCSGLPGWASIRKVKTIWILLKQETVSGSGISWAICKSAPRSRQATTPTPHDSGFYRPDALHAAQSTVSKHSRQYSNSKTTWVAKNNGWGSFPLNLARILYFQNN